MSPTSPTILDDLDIPKRTAHLAVMGKAGASIYSHLALHTALRSTGPMERQRPNAYGIRYVAANG